MRSTTRSAHVATRRASRPGARPRSTRSSATWRKWRRELIAAERDALLSSRDAGEIGPEVMRRIERDLDLEESRIGG